jgi:hypothetical protein
MNTYVTAADAAAIVRNQLKAKGINSRMVSVRADNFAGGSALRISIKSPDVSSKLVSEIAEGQESIRRCEMTGEILSGGNRYVSVSYSREALDAMSARYVEQTAAALAKLPEGDTSRLEKIEGTECWAGRTQYGAFSLWSERNYIQQCSGAKDMAAAVASLVLNAQ